MSKQLDIRVERDHLMSLTKANAKSAITELIWNSLDADATIIEVRISQNAIGIEAVEVMDNGHGINFGDAERIFGTLGGSIKKTHPYSPNHRSYHGKEGKGRFKAMALGSLISFESRYKANGKIKSFDVDWDRNNLNHPSIDDPKDVRPSKNSTGVRIGIQNIDQENASPLLRDSIKQELEIEFAAYYLTYPNFSVIFDGHKLEFRRHIKKSVDHEENIITDSSTAHYHLRIIEWAFDVERKLHFCSTSGVTYLTDNLGIRGREYPITVYVMSDYIEKIQRDGKLVLGELDSTMSEMILTAKQRAREYIRQRMQEGARDYIDELKREDLYPYKEPTKNVVEEAERQVFDIVAVQINEYLPTFTEQDKKNKRLTFALVKEALENDTNGLQRILTEVVNLPKQKVDDLNEILEKTSLSNVIDTFKVINDRITIINELRLLLFDERFKHNVLERKHLHKIVKNESWIFGDDFTYGVDDVNLKNVLKANLKHLGREDFEEIVESSDNSHLEDIPDICLWKHYFKGQAGYHRNLVIELKRPSKTITTKELEQIKKYSRAVASDSRFPKEKTSWVFILLATELNEDALSECEQKNRKFGHIDEKEGIDVFVIQWGTLLNEAEARHQFLKDKINSNMSENGDGIDLLRKKYAQFLPSEITQPQEQTPTQVTPN
ncbi:MAG: ATP-binding protein [Bacteroidota bacterium]|nr:ATP-binding protein [Bacteroidota bacterium]